MNRNIGQPQGYNIMSLKIVLFGCVLMALTACSTSISEYQHTTPNLVVETFFNGQLEATGIVKNHKGKVIRTFVADINAYWQDGIGTLDEHFVFDDGEKQQRVWKLTPQTNISNHIKSYTATANDVVNVAQVNVSGNAMFLKYVLTIPYKNSTINITVDDKMYLVNDTVIINESRLTKFGLHVGSITLTIQKHQ